jgi:hypothetical protein
LVILRRIHDAEGLTRAKVAAVATQAGQPADLKITCVPMDQAAVLASVLRSGKSRSKTR